MGKRKKVEEEVWKPVNVDYSSLTAEDFEMFGGIEELTDYEVVKTDEGKKSRLGKKVSKKRAKQDVKEPDVSDDDNIEEETVDDDNIEEETVDDEPDMSAWCNLYVPEEILASLQNLGFYKPTEIQALSLAPAIRDHLDILAAAETGSGKTLAFGIPIISHIMAAKERNQETGNENKLKALILTPTRELAIQVRNHLQAIAKPVGIKVIAIVGGMSQEKQKRLLHKSPEVVVATPGRLWQLMEEGESYLGQVPFVRYLVLDEADRMVEKGHYEEITKLLEIINEDKEKKRRQNFIFSATLTIVHEAPKRLMMKKRKKRPVEKNKLESLMSLIGVSEKPKIIDITRKSGVVETLTESQITCTMEEKDTFLYYFIATYPGRTLVFCNSISSVRRLKSVFEHLECPIVTLHASMHQRQRLKNLETFTSSAHSVLLASDVAARGLDIKGIEHVVHFQVPRTVEIYIHRSGRTARAQNEGLSLMLVEPQEAVYYKKIIKALNNDQSLPAYPVDQAVLKSVKERVALARIIDKHAHTEQRKNAQNRWFLKAAEEMDVEFDDDTLLNELGDEQERASKAQKLKNMKKQLSIMLKRPLVSRMFTGSYPTKSGKLVLPEISGAKKAVNTMKESVNKSAKKKKRKINIISS